MPAQRRKPKLRKKVKSGYSKRLFKLFFLLFVIITFIYWITSSKYFNSRHKLSVAVNQKDSDVVIVTFDPELGEIYTITIPANTQINLSRQLGVWKAGKIWQLGKNEGYKGSLLAESLTKYFKFPIYVWADSGFLDYLENNPLKLISALFKYLDTNLVIGDRIRLAFFSLRTRNSKRVNIDLKDTSYLKKEELVSGEEGFIKTETVPNEMVIIFSEPNIAKKNLKAIIYNTTSQNQTAEEIGEILELIGVKVASILKKDEEIETDCLIYSKDNDVEEIFAKLFACEISEKPMENKFDIEIKLGKKFADRF